MARLPRWSLAAILFPLFALSCEGPVILILPTALPNGVEDSLYEVTLSTDADGGANFSITNGRLPNGITLDAFTGEISGVPTEFGTFAFTIESNQGGFTVRSGERSYNLTIHEKLRISGSLDPARQGEEYTETVDAFGGVMPYTFTIVGLPGGISFNNTTGAFSGTPPQPDAGRTVRVTVTDAGSPQQSVTRDFFFEVKPRAVSISTTLLSNGNVGIPYSDEVEVEDGLQPYSFAIIEGVLPNGLSLPNNRRTGVISGTPTQDGLFTFTIEVTDSDTPPTTASREFTINIVP